jgi:hypothetical protein
MPSLKTIRQEILEQVPGAFLGTAGSSSTTTELADTDDEQTLFTGDGGTDYTGYWIIRADAAVAGDRVRRITFHDRNQGVIKPARAWTNAPTSETYELWPPEFRPADVDSAINRGLTELPYLVEESLTLSSADNEYTISYDWLDHERKVLEVYWSYTNSGIVHREEYPWWKVFPDAGVFKLQLDPIPSTATGNSVLIEGKAYYTELATDAATTACPLSWAVAKGLVVLLEDRQNTGQGQDVTRWSLQLVEARRQLYKMSKKFVVRRGRRMMTRTSSRMTPGRVRRGEFYY